MRMRPSLRCARMNPPPESELILGSNSGPGKARLADAASARLARLAHRTPARPGQCHEVRRQRLGELALARVVDRIKPLDARLAQLARPVTLVERVEHAALTRRAVLDIGVARERRDGNAVAARRVDRHLARDERNADIVDRYRFELAKIQCRFGIAERPIAARPPCAAVL